MTTTIQIRKKGSLTLPMELRHKYNLDEGDVFTLIDLGDGSFLLTPRVSQINRLGDRVSEILKEEEISLDHLLNTLDEERERYYRDHYAEG
ncbi:MAG: AbrB/MazE/SpoVT family DNA-binding domain-containing protein [Chloroflexi bacterium]|nr:AbrB/MazE/SpoVT family DNA-binding domain-containing protein [Chloroflexota bacterium]